MDKPTANTQGQIRVFAGKLVNPSSAKQDILITIQDEKIASLSSTVGQAPTTGDIDARGYTVIPGLIDIHIHGAVGEDFTLDCTEKARSFLASRGTTGFLATTLVLTKPAILAGLEQVRQRIAEQKPQDGAQILGIRCEGPFFQRLPGAQMAELCWQINSENIDALLGAAGEDLRMLDLSPELPKAEALIAQAAQRGVTVSAAHTEADAGQMERAFRAGLSHMTHIFNATECPPAAAGKGVLGVSADTFTLANDGMTAEVIVDHQGYHVSPYWLEVLFRCKSKSKIALISDSTSIAGQRPGVYPQGDGSKIILRDGQDVGWLESQDKKGLCGSAMTLRDGLVNLMDHRQINIEDAIECATLSPARILGLDQQKGSIEPGKDADLVVLDDQLQVVLTIIAGEVVYQRQQGNTS